MNPGALLGMASVVAIVGFIVFAFRQGLKVKPDASGKGGGDYSGGNPGDGGGGAGGHGGGH